jgi:hypothetical protein
MKMNDDFTKSHIVMLYLIIAALMILLLGGCAVVVKQGATPPLDPLTRKHY